MAIVHETMRYKINNCFAISIYEALLRGLWGLLSGMNQRTLCTSMKMSLNQQHPHKNLGMTVFIRNLAFGGRDTQVWHAQAHWTASPVKMKRKLQFQ